MSEYKRDRKKRYDGDDNLRKKRRKDYVSDSYSDEESTEEIVNIFKKVHNFPDREEPNISFSSSFLAKSEVQDYIRRVNLGSSGSTSIKEGVDNEPVMYGGRKKKNIQKYTQKRNGSSGKERQLGKKGKKKKANNEKKKQLDMGQPSFLGNVWDLDAKDFIVNPDELKTLQEVQAEDDMFDESLQLVGTIVKLLPNLEGFKTAAAEYSSLVLAKRAMGPEHMTTLPNAVQVGTLWLAWVTILFDLWQNCMTGNKSLFDEVPAHYRRNWHMILPNKYGRYIYNWVYTDLYDVFNFNVSGPLRVSLAWFSGGESATTGRKLLVNNFPTLTPDIIRTYGVEAANNVFQLCMNETSSRLVPIAIRPNKLKKNMDASAYAVVRPDNDPNLPALVSIESETPLKKCNSDIAELNLVDSLQSTRKSAKYKFGSVSGVGNNFYKLYHPNMMFKRVRMLYKEINVSTLLWATLAALIPTDQVGNDQLGVNTITQPSNSVFSTITSGTFWTMVLLEACHRYSFGSTSVALNGCLTGSTPIGGGSVFYTPVNTNNALMLTCVKEIMSQFSVHAAGERPDDAFDGIEFYVPYLAIRGTRVSGNPYEQADNADLQSAVQQVYPSATVGAYVFATPAIPAIPNFYDSTITTECMFLGSTPSQAVDDFSVALSAKQASVDVDNFRDYKATATLSYYTLIVSNPQVGTWDDTLEHEILLLSNRFLISPQTQGFILSLTPIFYASSIEAASSYLNFFSENSALLSDNSTQYGKIVTRFFMPFSHQRATYIGYGENAQLQVMIQQMRGGGYAFLTKIGKKLLSAAGRTISGMLQDSLETKRASQTIMHLANDPGKYGAVAALAYARVLDMKHY